MQHRYFKMKEGLSLPPYDAALTNWLEEQTDCPTMVPYKILVCNENVFYRALTCDGLGEYVRACEFLRSLGLIDTSDYDKGLKGYDSVFLSQSYINAASAASRAKQQ